MYFTIDISNFRHIGFLDLLYTVPVLGTLRVPLGKGEVNLPRCIPHHKNKKETKTKMEQQKRQRISKDQIRTRQINVSVSDEEKTKITEFASSGNMSVSEYCRLKSLQYPLSHKFDRAILQDILIEITKHTAELKFIGNNINQMAHVANRKGEIPADLKGIHEELKIMFAEAAEINLDIRHAMKNKSIAS